MLHSQFRARAALGRFPSGATLHCQLPQLRLSRTHLCAVPGSAPDPSSSASQGQSNHDQSSQPQLAQAKVTQPQPEPEIYSLPAGVKVDYIFKSAEHFAKVWNIPEAEAARRLETLEQLVASYAHRYARRQEAAFEAYRQAQAAKLRAVEGLQSRVVELNTLVGFASVLLLVLWIFRLHGVL